MPKKTYIRSGGTWVDITSGAAFPASSSAPASPQTGQVYFDTDDQRPYIYNGTAWVLFASASIPLSTVTTAGDVIYGTGASTVTRLGIGTAGQVLTVNAGATAPSWASASSGLATPNPQTASYTVLTGDLDKMVEMNVATANNVTVGTGLNSLAAGSQIHILQTGAGQTTIVASSVTVNATPGLKLRAQWSAATLVKRTAANVTPGIWVAFGDLTA